MKPREGDFIESTDGLIFDVKGLTHPVRRVIAFVRYFPDAEGDRRRNGQSYRKVYSLSKRYLLLKERFPQYSVYDSVFDETLCEVSEDAITKHHQPVTRLAEIRNSTTLDALEEQALQLAELFKEAGNVPWNSIGVSGSVLVGLHAVESDIDLVVYGSRDCTAVYRATRSLLEDERSSLKPYATENLRALYEFRSKDTAMSFEEFVKTESRKALQGKFRKTDFFVRFVKNWDEIWEKYGDILYKNVGYSKVRAVVTDDSESIFTPCRYLVEDAGVIEGTDTGAITEVASFRGRFCEQARTGESIIAQGKVEKVTDTRTGREHYRLLLGNKPSDHMILA